MSEVLQALTDKIILTHDEKEKLKKFASKITKLPEKIVIPGEYLEGKP